MRILIENSGYDLLNHGDVAMLQAAVIQLRSLWPEAVIRVVTRSPERLARCCPGTIPLVLHGAASWRKQSIRKHLHRKLPPIGGAALASASRFAERHMPTVTRQSAALQTRLFGYYPYFLDTDLVVATGGGYITDSFETFALLALDTLDLASRLGKPVALFGHGLGPLQQPALRAMARRVLTRATLVTLREGYFGLPLLRELGVPRDHIMVGGDEAIHLAYQERQPTLGNGIGVNLRVATYSGVAGAVASQLHDLFQAVATQHQAQLLPVPIDMGGIVNTAYNVQGDIASIRQMLGGQPTEWPPFETPQQVIRQVSRCRVVVTGSYHAAVFALSQGIPAICLAKSTYYTQKFLGLADQFGAGCAVLFLGDSDVQAQLAQAIGTLWRQAAELRAPLLAAAERQIAIQRAAYNRLARLVPSRLATAEHAHALVAE